MHHIAGAFNTEWCKLAPVVEYLIDTEINETGFSAYELQTGYALLETHDVTLAPFHLPNIEISGISALACTIALWYYICSNCEMILQF